MYELVLVFHLLSAQKHEPVESDFRTLHISEVSLEACERERAWWAIHFDAQPPGWTGHWETLVGPACVAKAAPRTPALVG